MYRLAKLRCSNISLNGIFCFRVGGLGQKVLADGVEIIEFPDMKHGWTVKGDLSVPEVERDVKKTFSLVLTFFSKYLH